MKINVYDENAKNINSVSVVLEDNKMSEETKVSMLHAYNRYVLNRLREGNASTKTRAEVEIGNKKAYNQKGTGNARRGANSTPLRRGGGVTFGPKPRSYSFKINKKVLLKSRQLMMGRLEDKLIQLKDGFKVHKTKDANKFLKLINPKGRTVILVSDLQSEIVRVFRNISNVTIYHVNYYKPEHLLTAEKVILTNEACQKLIEELK